MLLIYPTIANTKLGVFRPFVRCLISQLSSADTLTDRSILFTCIIHIDSQVGGICKTSSMSQSAGTPVEASCSHALFTSIAKPEESG